ncbi:hypothetical protein ABXT54_02810 [Methylophilaceae bacterium Uisw_099_01]
MPSLIEIKSLIEPHFHSKLVGNEYILSPINARELLTHNRIDIAFKILFIEMLHYDVDFARRLYIKHLKAFGLGEIREPGNDLKNNAEAFIDEFKSIFSSIQHNGFDKSKTIIPIGIGESILNGAHRVACSILLEEKIYCTNLGIADYSYDYKYFIQRNMTEEDIEAAVTSFIEHASNVFIALVWPSAIGGNSEIENLITNIIYCKEIQLNKNGAKNLLTQVYNEEAWIGDESNEFNGISTKLQRCFANNSAVRVIAFQESSLSQVQEIKEAIRDVFKIGKHSIHITDNKEETLRMARLLFNSNSIHFLNNAFPSKNNSYSSIREIKYLLRENHISESDIVFDSGIVLSMYGLRETMDIDFISNKALHLNSETLIIDSHDTELKYHTETKDNLIYNPKLHFYFNDIKFVSLEQVYKMKAKRAELKDINDLKLIRGVISRSHFKTLLYRAKVFILYTKTIIGSKINTSFIFSFLKRVGLYNFIRFIYRSLKGK